jgi:hypothetical protein
MDSIEYNLETVGREMKASVEELEVATKSVALVLCPVWRAFR